MLERLWSGWRASYVTGTSGPPVGAEGADDEGATGSVFTRLLHCGLPDDETYIVHRAAECFVVVNIYPYTSGHLLVVPYREVADLADLTPAETTDLWATVSAAATALQRAYRPNGMNIGLNLGRAAGGSVPEHLHVHLVPRWIGDSNFMSSIANTQTLPEAPSATAAKVVAAWPEQSTAP